MKWVMIAVMPLETSLEHSVRLEEYEIIAGNQLSNLTSLTKTLIQQTLKNLMFVIMHLAICLGKRTWHTETFNQCLLNKGVREGIKTIL